MYQDRLKEAEEYYCKSIEISKTFKKKPFHLVQVYSEWCNILQTTERFPEFFSAMKACEKVLKEIEKENSSNRNFKSEWENLWTLYAYAYNAQGHFDKAGYYCDLLEKSDQTPTTVFNVTNIRASIFDARGEYEKALQQIDISVAIDPFYLYTRHRRIEILSHLENAPRTWEEAEKTILMTDSIRDSQFNAQLDELRTRYEVDKHIAEKERTHSYFLFALAGCILLAFALGIWIYYNRKVHRKNRTLAGQIRELIAQQELRDAELLNKTSFVRQEEADNDTLCPENRMDKLCDAIRNLILKGKAYRNPSLTRDYLVVQLGTNRELFIEAFMHCFRMSFPEYINSLRLKDAVILLQQSDTSIEVISEKTGFGTVRTFQRQFQKKYNLSPKDYRKAMQKSS
jgi:AraC-like DNA-binding protein